MGTTLHWHDANQEAGAPPVVFLHGFMGCGEDWNEVVESLGDSFRCLCPDLPGHGASRDVAEMTVPQTCAVLAQDLDRLGIGECALVGYSMGGRAALEFATRLCGRVRRLVLESASPGLESEEARLHRRNHDEAIANRLSVLSPGGQGFRDFLVEWYATPLWASLDKHAGLKELLIERRLRGEPTAFAACLRSMGTGVQDGLWEDLPKLTVPALLMAGEEDGKFRRIAERMAESLPNGAVHIVPDCGHNVHLENPGRYTTVLRAFLSPMAG